MSGGVNDPNLYGDRTGLAALVAGIAALVGWSVGAEMVLYHYKTFQPPVALFHLILRWGLVPAPWGWRRFVPAVGALMFGGSAGWAVWRWLTIPPERHVRGFVLHHGPRQIAAALKPPKGEIEGVHIHPQVVISQRQETYHYMVVGGTGAGKTTILWPWVQQAIARGDRVLIFDSKGDFTQKVPLPFTLLSPTDARSSRWVLGRDVRTPLEAHALSTTLIQEPPGGTKSDPMWIQGSRALLAGLVIDLQTRFGEQWGMAHLAYECAAALSDFDRLKTVILREAPICIILLGGEDAEGPGRTTMGFLAQIVASFTNVIYLGVAAADQAKNPGWSIRGWLTGKTPPTVVLGFRGEQSKEMSQIFVASVIERVVRQIGGFKDTAPDKRRIWLVIDETPEAGYVPSITTSLTTLRSKGARVVLGFQTLASVREKYSKDVAHIWEGQCDIKIIGKLTAGADQEWASRLLGDREVERYQHQLSQQPGNDQRGQHSSSWQRVREPILMPSSFGQELGMQTDSRGRLLGPRALMFGGDQAAILDWPLTPRTVLREPVVDARWIQPGYKPPAWGKTPPDIAAPPASAAPAQPDPKRKEQTQAVTAMVPVPTQDPDLPGAPVPKSEPDIGDHLAEEVAGHMLDMALPGAGLAARILGLASQSQATPSAPQQPGIAPPTQEQEQDRDQEQEP